MDIFFVCIAILLAMVFILYPVWKLMNHIAQEASPTNAENQIRSDWHQSFFTYLLGHITFYFSCYILLTYYANNEAADKILEECLSGAVHMLLSTAIMFYFAYVKSGTKWIGFFLFISPISLLIGGIVSVIMVGRFSLSDLIMIEHSINFFITYVFAIPLYIYFWIHCKQLYELNRTIKKRKLEQVNNELEVIIN